MKEIELYHTAALQQAFEAGEKRGSGYLNEAIYAPNYFEWIGQNKKRLAISIDHQYFIEATTATQIVRKEGSKMVTMNIIETIVSSVYGVTIDELRNSNSHIGRIMQARRAVYYMAYFHIHTSLEKIGERWGQKDHSTALCGAKRLAGYASSPGRDLNKLKEVYRRLYIRGYNVRHFVQDDDVASRAGVNRITIQPVKIEL